MKFDELDTKLRVYETSHDFCVLPNMYMVARLDGRSFTRLTKDVCAFEAPFDIRFRDMMIEVCSHLMQTGIRVTYAYTQSDEISLLIDIEDQTFGRKLRKLNSVLAGEASGKFSLQLGHPACFDCRISQLPNLDLVLDYFRWRSEDAGRNALNAHCYWRLRGEGISAQAAQTQLAGLSIAAKNEFLFARGLNFNDLPNWQKAGVGLYWTTVSKEGVNPLTGQQVETQRKTIEINLELPIREAYSDWLRKRFQQDRSL